jgi:hypothetical protein
MTSQHAFSDGGGGMPIGPLSVSDLERLVASLPAQQRAALAWTPRDLRAAIDSIRRSDDVTDEVLATAAEQIFRLILPVIEPIATLLGGSRLSAEVSTLWNKELSNLRTFLPDPPAVHAAEWIFRAFDGIMRTVLQSIDRAEIAEAFGALEGLGLPPEMFKSEAGALFRAQALMMAAIAEAEERGDAEKAAQLIDHAVLEMATTIDMAGRIGLTIDPYQGEAQDQRAARLLGYVQDIRDTLTTEDIDRTVASGRLTQLR